jgi:hypothetical protein
MPIDFGRLVGLLVMVGMVGLVALGLKALNAWTRRIGRDGAANTLDAAALRSETAELLDQVQRLTSDVAELHERVDFTERLLARQRDAERLKG